MLSRLLAHFDPERIQDPSSVLGLIVSDYLAYYRATPTRVRWGVAGSYGQDPPRKLALMFVPRMLNNPSLHAIALIRLANASPAWMINFWRTLLLAKHSIDIHRWLSVGPGLVLPHPHGITFGAGITIGRNVTILHHVSIGGLVHKREGRLSPTIEDDVVIYGHSMVLGPITLGEGSVVGMGAWLDRDLGAGEIRRGAAAFARSAGG